MTVKFLNPDGAEVGVAGDPSARPAELLAGSNRLR
jgi:hypothetical protein